VYGSFLNLVVDDSASMGRLGIESARQAAMQLLQYVASRDRRTGETTPCSAWTFADEPVLVGSMLPARDLLQLPLLGHGASMLGRALRAVADASEASIDAQRLRSKNRQGFGARACTILIGDLEASDDWMPAAERLARLGRIGLVLAERGPRSTTPGPESLLAFHATVHAHELGQQHMESLVSP
jgi:hypothetical protein